MIVRTVLAFAIGWAALHAVQQYWLATVTAQITENSGLQLMPPVAELPKFDIDPLKWQTFTPPQIDMRPYQRAWLEGMTRDIVRQNNEAMARMREAMRPPYIPGLHR